MSAFEGKADIVVQGPDGRFWPWTGIDLRTDLFL